ncbi:MAG: DUF1570 domain-containing protein [Kiritimatiellia bacterium]
MDSNRFQRWTVIFRRIFFWFRLGALMLFLGVAVQLVRWSHAYDPRFYQFLGTPPGRALSSLMEWPNLHNRTGREKPFEKYSDEEKYWHRHIQTRLQQSWPTHTLELRGGEIRHVRILSQEQGQLRIREHFGMQGRLETTLSASEVLSLRPYDKELPEVSLRDVHFQMEYPDFDLTYFGHYTVLTDAPYYQVADSVEILEELHRQYLEIFGPLIRFPRSEQSLQVLFFSNEHDFRAHQDRTAPDLHSSVGYFSPLEDRMVVFNQQFSDRANQIRQEVEADIAALLNRARSQGERREILKIQQQAEQQIRERAKRDTVSTLRHEAAHYLSYTFGVHSWIHAENGWLIEGMASYFEQNPPQGLNPGFMQTLLMLEMQDRIPPLRQLMEIRQPENFETELSKMKAYEAYALSWSLFHFCMQPENRKGFFAYLRHLQSPPDIGKLMNHSRMERLAVYLRLTPQELEKAWRRMIREDMGIRTPKSA